MGRNQIHFMINLRFVLFKSMRRHFQMIGILKHFLYVTRHIFNQSEACSLSRDHVTETTYNPVIFQVFLKTLKRFFCLTEPYYPLDESETISLKGLDKPLINSETAVSKQGVNKMERDIGEILRCLNTLIARNVAIESRKDIHSEWYQLAIVFDRILCFFFFVIFVIYSCVLFA